jgi:hypothetical protein
MKFKALFLSLTLSPILVFAVMKEPPKPPPGAKPISEQRKLEAQKRQNELQQQLQQPRQQQMEPPKLPQQQKPQQQLQQIQPQQQKPQIPVRN